MMTWTSRIGFVVLAVGAVAHAEGEKTSKTHNQADTAKTSKTAMKSQAITVNAKDVKWGDAPPDLPKGAKLGVLYGDPSKPALYTIRLKLPDGYKIPPHWHAQDEQLTILAGTLVLHMGDTMAADAHELGVDGFHFLPGKTRHAAEAKGETVVQITGMGPFNIQYLNPGDNPNPKSAKK